MHENRMAPLGYVVCNVTDDRFDTDSNSLQSFNLKVGPKPWILYSAYATI